MRAITNSQHYESIAAAIRGKGYEGSLKPNEMAPAILALDSGGGDITYNETVKEIIPATYGSKYTISCPTYSYTTSWSVEYVFSEPTTEPYYFVVNNMVGFSSYIYVTITYSNGSSGQFTATAQSGANGGSYQIPIGTTKITFSYGFYITDVAQSFSYFLSKDGVNITADEEGITVTSKAMKGSEDKTNEYVTSTSITTSAEFWEIISAGKLTIGEEIILQSEGVSF